MISADYAYYRNSYGGSRLGKEDCRRYLNSASEEIDVYTFGNIKTASTAVRDCCCEVAEHRYRFDAQTNAHAGRSGEKVGDYSVSYTDGAAARSRVDIDVYAIIYRRLANTGLLYRGVF